jgi:hypothetical protein
MKARETARRNDRIPGVGSRGNAGARLMLVLAGVLLALLAGLLSDDFDVAVHA